MQQHHLSRLRPVQIRRLMGAVCFIGPLSALFLWFWCGMLDEHLIFSSAAHPPGPPTALWQSVFITVGLFSPSMALLMWVPPALNHWLVERDTDRRRHATSPRCRRAYHTARRRDVHRPSGSGGLAAVGTWADRAAVRILPAERLSNPCHAPSDRIQEPAPLLAGAAALGGSATLVHQAGNGRDARLGRRGDDGGSLSHAPYS